MIVSGYQKKKGYGQSPTRNRRANPIGHALGVPAPTPIRRKRAETVLKGDRSMDKSSSAYT